MEGEAKERCEAMLAEASEDGAPASVQRLAGGLDLRQFPLDSPLPDLPPSNAARDRQKMLIDLARRESLTIRQLGRRFAFSLGHMVYVGTAPGLADFMEDWFTKGAADGFTMLSPYYPGRWKRSWTRCTGATAPRPVPDGVPGGDAAREFGGAVSG